MECLMGPSLWESNKLNLQWRKRPRVDRKCHFQPHFIFIRRWFYRQVCGVERDSRYALKPATPRTEICTLSHGWKRRNCSRVYRSFWILLVFSFFECCTALKTIHCISHEAGPGVASGGLFTYCLLCTQTLLQVSWVKAVEVFFQG